MTPTPSPGSGRGRVFLHVGAPKTGTTYLQNVLWHNRDALARDGVLLPGKNQAAHHDAALALRGASFSEEPVGPEDLWDLLAAEARGWDGDVLVTSELLAWATREQVERALAGWEPREVHVVFTARDLVRQVPAVWQEDVKNRRTLDYAEFLRRAIDAGPDQPGPGGIWGGQDPRQVLGRWAAPLSPDRVHVVTLPPPGHASGLLWERFCSVLEVEPDDYDTDITGANVGLGLAEAELLRRVNLALPDDFAWPSYRRFVKHGIAESALSSGASGRKVRLPGDLRAPLAERAGAIEDYLQASGFHVVGRLEDLAVSPDSGGSIEAEAVPAADDVAEAGVRAVVELLIALQERRETIQTLRARIRQSRRRHGKDRKHVATTEAPAPASAPPAPQRGRVRQALDRAPEPVVDALRRTRSAFSGRRD